MNNNFTYRKFINLMKEYAELHPQINDFGYGNINDISKDSAMKYPYLWISENNTSTIEVVNRNVMPQVTFSFNLADKINETETSNGDRSEMGFNGLDVTSNLLSILLDFVGKLVDDNTINYEIVGISHYPAYDIKEDGVNVRVADITIRFRQSWCNDIF